MKSIIVLASGTKTGGGSGFEKLVEYFNGFEDRSARVVGVVSNVLGGGVEERAKRLGIPFLHLPNDQQTSEGYQAIASFFGVGDPLYAASGWLRFIVGLPPKCTINIHPALLSQCGGRFGGKGMHGRHVHEAVRAALDAGKITESGFSMHFVTSEYDRGPVFAEVRVPLSPGTTPDEIGAAVNHAEHAWQPRITEKVVRGEISLSLEGHVIAPDGYEFLPRG